VSGTDVIAVPPGQAGKAQSSVVICRGKIKRMEIGLASASALVDRRLGGAKFEPGIGI
jgi:hypothetical protein